MPGDKGEFGEKGLIGDETYGIYFIVSFYISRKLNIFL